jgi:carbon monoxide dehydrogenase subunit G
VAEAEYSTTTRIPADAVWRFVEDMDNWARFVTGYQRHEKQSETDSTWTLKGDLGVLARTLTFRVHVTEWNGPSRVAFELSGVNEPMAGEGAFTIESAAHADARPAAAWPAGSRRSGAGCSGARAVRSSASPPPLRALRRPVWPSGCDSNPEVRWRRW